MYWSLKQQALPHKNKDYFIVTISCFAIFRFLVILIRNWLALLIISPWAGRLFTAIAFTAETAGVTSSASRNNRRIAARLYVK